MPKLTDYIERSVASFFSGAGGLDLGFERAGFRIPYANEYDKNIWATYEANFPETFLDHRDLNLVEAKDVPTVDGMIGGPPCQSWSEAGTHRGIDDKRGRLFHEYVRLIEAKQPLFFVAENVSGILSARHEPAFRQILESFAEIGYNVSYGLLNANDYGVAQDRERVIIVGYQTHVKKFFLPPVSEENYTPPVLRDVIWDLRKTAKPARDNDKPNTNLRMPNHEYLVMDYSPMFMSRNRVRQWNQPSFTIQASGRQAPLHPQAPPMTRLSSEKREFVRGKEDLYRRLTVREAARIQSFPDEHEFIYRNVSYGYKMIGNAVPVEFSYRLASQIREDLLGVERRKAKSGKKGSVSTYRELGWTG